MNTKNFVFVICVEAIRYLLLYNLHDCTIKWHIRSDTSSDIYWFVQRWPQSFSTERLEFIVKIRLVRMIFHCTRCRNYWVRSKISSIAKKRLVKVTCTIFRELQRSMVHQLLLNLAIWADFGWLSSSIDYHLREYCLLYFPTAYL